MAQRKHRVLIAIAILFSLAGCKNDDPVAPEYPDYIRGFMSLYNVPGVSIAVIEDYRIKSLEVYGIKDMTSQEPVTEQTLFQAASISKSVSATAALKLVQDGKINLDEDINQTLFSWQLTENVFTREEKVTLKRLLSHTAGTTVSGFPGYSYFQVLPTLMQILNGTPPANSPPIVVDVVPGTLWRYSGGGYCVLQQAVMDVEQKNFPQFVQETVFTPLAMQSSTFEQPLPQSSAGRAATGYFSNGSSVPGNYHLYPELAAAGMWTTPADVALFLIEIQQSLRGNSNRVLNKAVTELMLTPVLGDSYGLGFTINRINGETYFGHGGANVGFRCIMTAHQTAGVGAVVMTNSDNGDELLSKVVDLIAERESWPGY